MSMHSFSAAVSATPLEPAPTSARRVAALRIRLATDIPTPSRRLFPALEVLPQPTQTARLSPDLFAWQARELRATEIREDLISAIFLLCGLAAVALAFW